MEYIRIYLSFYQSRKTKKLIRQCGHEGVSCLQKLWIYATHNKQSGRLNGMTSEDIELEVDWTKNADEFTQALVKSEYLIKDGEEYVLCNWLENNPHLDPEAVAKRKSRAAKGGKAKAEKAASKQEKPACKNDISTKPLLNPANLKEPNLKEPNKDKLINKEKDVLPDWLNREAWAWWEQHRKEKKKRLTPLSVKQQIAFLEKNQKDHIDIINQSIMNGWTGLFLLSGSNKQDDNAWEDEFHKKHEDEVDDE